jgi:hypothetical protein
MKNWLRRALRRFLEGDSMAIEGNMVKSARSDDYEEEQLRFTLTPAIGGRILRVNRTVQSKHMGNSIGSGSINETATYVIPTGEDVGERVSKILNLELLK